MVGERCICVCHRSILGNMAAGAALISLLSCVILHHASSQLCNNVTSFTANLDTLLAEYPREDPPPQPLGAPALLVSMELDVRHATLDEKAGRMRLIADLHLVWKDSRLEWNSTEWGCDTAHSTAERLWRPDLTLLNAGANTGSTSDDLPARLRSDGTVEYSSRMDVTVPVGIDLEDWPGDTQSAKFSFGSRSLSAEQLALEFSSQKYVTVSESGAWEIMSVTNMLVKTDTVDDQRYIASWRVSLRRRAPAHSLAAGAVFATTVTELVAATLLPLEGRAPLYACAAFTGTLWLISALLRMPHAATAPISLSLMSAICVLSAVACVFTGIVQRVARFRLSPPGVVRRVLTAASGVCKLTPDEGSSSQVAESGAWAAAAKLLDYLLISTQLVVLFIIVCVYMFS